MAPGGLLHRLPLAEGVQAEIQEPGRLAFLGRDQADDILVQALGHELLLDFRNEAFLVFLGRYVPDDLVHSMQRYIIFPYFSYLCISQN